MTPSVERVRMLSSHCLAEEVRRWMADTTVPTPDACATSSTPRMISTAHGLSMSLKTRSTSPELALMLGGRRR